MAWLLMTEGPRTGERIEITGELVIGREQADLTIDDESLSRRHVAIRPCAGGVEIEDLDSKNGTWLDGSRLSEVTRVTSAGASLQLGDTVARIELDRERVQATRTRATRVRERAPANGGGAPVAAGAPAVAVRPFGAGSATAARRRRSAATRMPVATLLSFACVGGTAAALIAYFAAR